jgi:hypothetical protein
VAGCKAATVMADISELSSQNHCWLTKLARCVVSHNRYLIACGLIGEPVPPVMISGGPQKKNS